MTAATSRTTITPSISFLEGFAGLTNGSFYQSPKYVDIKKTPGSTKLTGKCDAYNVVKKYVNLSFFFLSPNIVWFLMAVIMWNIYPYYNTKHESMEDELMKWKTNPYKCCFKRIIFNYCCVMMYYSYWHISIRKICKRPFLSINISKQVRIENWNMKVLHNFFHTSLGSLQWSLVECAFIYGYLSNKLQYITTQQVIDNGVFSILYHFAFWSLFVVFIRDVHFYFAHRFIHLKFLYKYIHALHHRNTDIEPYSGMAMHPIEHFYYFTCYGPLLVCGTIHPFMILWMGVHVTITPACSHSGFEDHWQSDLMHYLHHVHYDCNYGTSGLPFDQWFDTYKDKLDPSYYSKYEKATTAATASTNNNTIGVVVDPKSTLIGSENVNFWIFGVVVPVVMLWQTLTITDTKYTVDDKKLNLIAFLISNMPILVCARLHLKSLRNNNNDKNRNFSQSFFGPSLEKKKESYLFILSTGILCTSIPACIFIRLVLSFRWEQ